MSIMKIIVHSVADAAAAIAAKVLSTPAPEPREDPYAVLADEAGYFEWIGARPVTFTSNDCGGSCSYFCPYTSLEEFFKARTGVSHCSSFVDGFAWLPKNILDEKGTWRTWEKLPKWFTKKIHTGELKFTKVIEVKR